MIGEKIKQERKNCGLSQEQLAEKLFVSRAAVAKWEGNYGIPDIENLKKLSELFGMSIDELVDNSAKEKRNTSKDLEMSCYEKYLGKKCFVEMTDWNDDVADIYILGQDDRFFYYIMLERRGGNRKVGALAKKFIKTIVLSSERKEKSVDLSKFCRIQMDYFIGKSVDIFLEDKHFLDGILGEDTEILDIHVIEVNEDYIRTVFGKNIKIEKITRIETNI